MNSDRLWDIFLCPLLNEGLLSTQNCLFALHAAAFFLVTFCLFVFQLNFPFLKN